MRRSVKILVTLAMIGTVSFTCLMIRRPVYAGASMNLMERTDLFRFDTQEELEERRNQRDQAIADAQAAASMVSALAGQANALSGELAELNDLSEEQRAQYEVISAQLAAALVAKTEALDAYIDAQENLAATELMFQERLSVMFEYQNKSTLEVLLESDSLAGFFTNMEIISLIADADAQAVDEMEIALANAEAQRELALQQADEMQAIADEKQAQLDELEERIGITTAALEDISTELDSWTAQENSLEALAASLDSQILSLQAQYDAEVAATTTTTSATTTSEQTETAQTNESGETVPTEATEAATPTPVPTVSTSGVSLQWPTWCHTITSPFGYRVHPIYGNTRFHSGIDIGAGFGDTIMAAASGTVIYVETPVPGQSWGGSGYGNYFIIDHGNGVSTLYAHCTSVYVSVGQYVSAGEAVGTVGSTGGSTGSHLHFEVRINGTRVDPLGCLP
ncbi:MAG: peptidoglycan DD-metalloendopeptidase family protein [Clostridiales bacterium]|nr:peptidoglycan DD-metalloendopeptidase family protein [Clostridiales bacterium]